MFLHNFSFRWKPGITDAEIAEVRAAILDLQGKIPGLLSAHAGINISPRGGGYTFGGTMQFPDRAALDAYNDHPVHQALLPRILPLLDSAIEVDFES